jgi:asparagine synthase (glutamine-hydrolysing)
MCQQIVHRGPDDEGQFARGPIGLGVRRLSIIDLEGGHQPMTTVDGLITIVFNGEIYNYRDIRADLESKGHRFRTDSDTECILNCYAEYGLDCLSRLNGMFAIAIWDDAAQRLVLARDRLGIKPLYVCDDGESCTFASETTALLTNSTVPREIDHEALAYYLQYGYVAAPATLFRGIRKLPPAHYMIVSRQGAVTRQFWALDYTAKPLAERDYAERLYHALRRSVGRQLVSDVPLGAFLSGGLDSTSIVHLMTDITGGAVNTYSVGFDGADRFHNELPDAARMAARFQSAHHELRVNGNMAGLIADLARRLDQPLADSSFIVTYLIAQLASRSVKVVMSGVGGDEIFGGYRRYLGAGLGRYYDWVPAPGRRLVRSGVLGLKVDRGTAARNYARLARGFVLAHDLPPFERYDTVVRLLSEPRLNSLLTQPAGRGSGLIAERRAFFEEPQGSDPVNRMMHLDLKTSLPESLLLLTDNMTMATSIEARVPFLDHELVELVARIPSSLKIKGARLRHIQKLSMRPHLPREVFKKRKWGFGCPVGRWFRSDLRELLRDSLAADRVRRKGFFDPLAVEALIEAHESYREDNADVLLGLLTFDLWHSGWADR